MTNDTRIGYQSWQHLLFVHWRTDPADIQKQLPSGLTVETFDGAAWLAVVPFSMECVRPWWSPPVPGISWFLETNLRTYVRHANGQSGVWFFSLDANHYLAVAVARTFWHLNYRYADLSLTADQPQKRFAGRRRDGTVSYEIHADVDPNAVLQTADEGTLEHFLLERYRLFSQDRRGQLFTGLVHHDPYMFVSAQLSVMKQTFTQWIDCDVTDSARPDHVAYSPGVDVGVSRLMPVTDSPVS